MEEAMVGSVVGATIQVVLQNLLSISFEEFNIFRDFKKDLEKLKSSFMMIQEVLYDAEMQQITNRAVNLWLKKLESLAFEADNVFDELNYHVLRNKNQNNAMKKVQAFFTPSNPIALRRKMAHKIGDIVEKLKLINQEARDFGLQIVKPVSAGFDDFAGRETDSFAADPIVLGREDDESRIIEMLTTSPTEQVFYVLPIVGMGGLGKTTLARQVFHNSKIEAHFDQQIWVYVSRTFDAVFIFKKILESLTIENKVEFGSREAILRRIQKDLGHKRYLLVLDDVWNEGREKWDDFLNSLSGISSVMGNGIIVTTRGESVASIVKTLPVYRLKILSKDKCWSIIKAKAFREGEVPLEFEIIGRNKIARRCQGLPLAAKVVGGLLHNKSKDEWVAIEQTGLSNFGEDENTILKVLKFSFDHLSLPSLKKCFAYCSIFPKGFSIKREQLIELWMAEGFLTPDRSNDMETVGDKFFNLLVQNSLFQVVERDHYGNITSCNMHDLVHDLASSVLGSKSYCVKDKSLDDFDQVRYIGLEGDDSLLITKQQTSCVRTLIFRAKVSGYMFLNFRSLHALVLMSKDVKELPSFIRELMHLRLVDISQTRIECLPDSIGKLYHLQTLRAEYLRRLPTTLKYLTCLRHLHIPNIELPPEIGRLTSLQMLPYFRVGCEKGCRIGELGSLKNLKGELEVYNLEHVYDKEEAKSACLFEKKNIFKLKFNWNVFREGEVNDEDVLEGLQPHPKLKSLEIYEFRGKCFPMWTFKMEVRDDLGGCLTRLNNLMEIRLVHCKECEEIPMVGHLPCLKSLYLNGLTNVRSIGSSFYGIDNHTTSTTNTGVGKNTIILFPALERLELLEMPNLKDWAEVEFPSRADIQLLEMVVFPRLEYLEIRGCRRLTSAPSHFPCLKELSISKMDRSSPFSNICGSNLFSLTELWIDGVTGLVCLPDVLFHNNQNLSDLRIGQCPNLTHLVPFKFVRASLKKLSICDCPNLREFPDELDTLSSLETMCIAECSNLKSIPYPSGVQSHEGFTSLRTLTIHGCEGLTNLASDMIESCAPSLEYLRLTRLSSLTNLSTVIGQLHKMSMLRVMEIVDVPEITEFSADIVSLHSLQELKIGVSSSSSSGYRLVLKFLNAIFRGSQSLRTLRLWGMENWGSLPDQLQHLTALSLLQLNGFGIEALPEWLGNMSSLWEMHLYNCKNLRHLPSKEAMQRLTKLTRLYFLNCPLLNVQRCNDSEWHKICHIRYFVD